ncbi:hypothetical protein FACS189418_8680 [Clostridia bacterium]|nr:hypothetical protein FACS189418_8680 [Clostridia bacterium]
MKAFRCDGCKKFFEGDRVYTIFCKRRSLQTGLRVPDEKHDLCEQCEKALFTFIKNLSKS